MSEIISGSISDLLAAYASRKTSPREVCQELFRRISANDARVGAFLRVDEEGALKAAAEAELAPEKPLSGVPLAIKDNISTRAMETTCGSRILQGYVPPFDATVIQRLKN